MEQALRLANPLELVPSHHFSPDMTLGRYTNTAVQDPSASNAVILDYVVILPVGSAAKPFEGHTFRLQSNVLDVDGSSLVALARAFEPNFVSTIVDSDNGTFTAVWGVSESKQVRIDGTATLTAGSPSRTIASNTFSLGSRVLNADETSYSLWPNNATSKSGHAFL